jgi:outer membrane receptor for ferrienterochelin and colicin
LASATTITQSLDITDLIRTGQLRVADQLRTLPALNFSTSSSPGDDATVNLRGFGSTETATLLDGHPVGPLGVLNPAGDRGFMEVSFGADRFVLIWQSYHWPRPRSFR